MALEDTLAAWTQPSSATEQDKQDRTERMVREAIDKHKAFEGCGLIVFAKGSYANNTNVRADSDVDIAVQCTECRYWEEATPGAHPTSSTYEGPWTPQKLRTELTAALQAKFPGQVDSSGSVALQVNSNSARVDADVVPCFTYRYYFSPTSYREGTKIFKAVGGSIVNYPQQQLDNGRAKNNRTDYCFKKTVRILKRVENAMVADRKFRELPSYFIECLAYNCPDAVFAKATWVDTVKAALVHIWDTLQGDEPTDTDDRWVEVNNCYYLFHEAQKWTRADGRGFAKAAWNHLGLADQ